MATRQSIGRISARIDELAERLGTSRSRPVLVYGPTRKEAEDNAAEFREKYPGEGDRLIRLLIMWAGEPLRLSSEGIHIREVEAGTWVIRPTPAPEGGGMG